MVLQVWGFQSLDLTGLGIPKVKFNVLGLQSYNLMGLRFSKFGFSRFGGSKVRI